MAESKFYSEDSEDPQNPAPQHKLSSPGGPSGRGLYISVLHDALPYVSCARIIKCAHWQKRSFTHMQLCRCKIAASVCLSSWWRWMINHNQTIMQPRWNVHWRLERWWWLNMCTKSVTVSTARKLSSKSCQCLLQDVMIPSFQVQSVIVIDALSHSGVS